MYSGLKAPSTSALKAILPRDAIPPDVNMDEGTWTTPMGMPITVVTTMAISSELLILYSFPPVLMRRKYSMKHMTMLDG